MTLDKWTNTQGAVIIKGDIVGVRGAQTYALDGLYEVDSVNLDKVTIKANRSNSIEDFTDESFQVVKFRQVRVSSLANLNASRYNVFPKQKVWVDSIDGDWGVIENNPVYSKSQT